MHLFSIGHSSLHEDDSCKTTLFTLHYLANYSSKSRRRLIASEPRRRLIEHDNMLKTHLLISAETYIVIVFTATEAVLPNKSRIHSSYFSR